MIAPTRPEPDETPDPELTTPARLAAELVAIATAASRLRIRTRGLALYLAPGPASYEPTPADCLRAVGQSLALASDQAVDLATAVRVGQVALDERYLDRSCRPERPLLDAIERRPLERAAEEIAPLVAPRTSDDPLWSQQVRRCRVCGCTDDDCRQCIAKTGVPCHWVEDDLCSACVSTLETGATDPIRIPSPHPQAEPARKAARRRKAAKGGDL